MLNIVPFGAAALEKKIS